jgi:ABC-type sugar transport system substrate-binding protein
MATLKATKMRKQVILVVSLFAAVSTLAASSSTSAGATTSSATHISLKRFGQISKDWVRWDTKSCSYVTATKHPATYWAVLRAAPGLKLAWGSQSETFETSIAASLSVKAAAKKAGINLIFGNYNYPSTSDPLTQAKTMAVQQPQGIISYLVLASLLQPVTAEFQKICAPTLQITVPYLNGPVFGLDNVDDGHKIGDILAKWAKKKGWTGSATNIVIDNQVAVGGDVVNRMNACRDSALAGAPGAQVSNLDVGTDPTNAQTAMTNWLTAHPDSRLCELRFILG